MTIHRAVLSVGSNLGDRLGTLQGCVHAISGLPETDVLAVSPVYETAPVGGPAQPDYLNAVLIAGTGLAPLDLLAGTQRIEADFGRVRAAGSGRFGPRTLDIDIISYDEQISGNPVLTLPHPRAHERAFVLAPWHDLDPAASLPGRGPVAALLAGSPRSSSSPWSARRRAGCCSAPCTRSCRRCPGPACPRCSSPRWPRRGWAVT